MQGTIAKKTCGIFSILMVVVLFASIFAIPVSAYNSGSTGSQTFSVSTKASYWYPGSSSITLKQSPAKFTYKKTWGKGTKTKKLYAYYTVTAKPTDGSKTITKKWNGTSSIKINLNKNKTYWITVKYEPYTTQASEYSKTPWGYTYQSSDGYYWSVSSMWKANYA